ncbi:MAG: hypothetical protein AAF513_18900 [Pseudomonadota bacterium]
MPLYICNTRAGALDGAAKTRVAQAITDIHCQVTGALASFVHAIFFEASSRWPLEDKTLSVQGTIRRGRSEQQRELIATSIQQALVSCAGVELEHTEVEIRETPASWVLEGGEIMPEPGAEDAWLAAQAARRRPYV